MSLKQILFILGVLTVTLLTTVAAFIWLFNAKPEVFGVSPAIHRADSLSLAVVDSTELREELQRKAEEERWKKAVDSLSRALADVQTSAAAVRSSYDSLVQATAAALQQQEQDEEAYAVKMDSLTRANYQTFAKIYDNASPPEVARILQNLDGREAAVILKMMKKKQAGKVLEAMNPERAATILRLSSLQF